MPAPIKITFLLSSILYGLELNRHSLKEKEISGHRFFLEEEQKRILFTQEYVVNQESTLNFIMEQENRQFDSGAQRDTSEGKIFT